MLDAVFRWMEDEEKILVILPTRNEYPITTRTEIYSGQYFQNLPPEAPEL